MRTLMLKLGIFGSIAFQSNAHAGSVEQIIAIQTARISQLEMGANPVGSIVQTIVKETDFQRVYGNKWVAMRGQDISGSKLCQTFKICRLPNAEGTFLRTSGPQAIQVGERLEQTLPSHTHLLDARGGAAITFVGNSGAGFTDLWMAEGGPSMTFSKKGTNQGGSDGAGSFAANTVPLVGSTGTATNVAGEVKPLSLTVHTFIRID